MSKKLISINKSISIFLVSLILALGLNLLTFSHQKILSQENPLISYTLDFTPPNRGTEQGNGTKKEGTTHSRSPSGNLFALVPILRYDNYLQKPVHQAQTSISYPSFWLFYGGELNSEKPVSISMEIRDQETKGKNYFYGEQFLVNPNSNLWQIKLSKIAPSLLTENTYKWEFIASREGKIIGETVGYINRLQIPEDILEFNQTSNHSHDRSIQQLKIYAQYGLWHELLDNLITLQQQKPDNLDFQYALNNLLTEKYKDYSLIKAQGFFFDLASTQKLVGKRE